MLEPGTSIPLVEVTRGDEVEARHRGFIAVVDPAGNTLAQLGDIETRTHFRSAAKPFQALPIVTTGAADHFQFTPRELAVINGSHSGEPQHLATVQSIFDKIGLTEAALQCGAHMPFDEVTTKQLRAAGQAPRVLHNNCSGKHAGMLALAKHLHHPIENYLDPAHPIQRLIRATLARFAAVPEAEIGVAVDGCSAPVFITTMAALARSYAQLVGIEHNDLATDQSLTQAAQRIVQAFILHPVMIGGTRNRLDTDLMRVAHGQLISKVGAEGVQLLGLLPCERYPRGLGIAIKVEDGDIRRARDPVVIETLRQLGVLNAEQLAQLAPYAHATIYNHRKLAVGMVRTCFELAVSDQ
ncbi:MAG: asparaginase [Acidobacteria bacterium]|nr:asparaginase [Acidobacteriota bacterium]MBI3421861.1 asparaginase [Acidobacteriota bacterium]